MADDSKTIRLILRNVLWELGIEDVKEATTGTEAIRELDNGEFDLVLLDLHMPEANGIAVLGHVRDAGIAAPVVVISSDSDYKQIEKARELGAYGYIKKPFKKEGLDAAIRTIRAKEKN